MPVVLEEFGCKLDARPDQYNLAYDSCLTSAKRGGSCAGVMFWDLAHKVGFHSSLVRLLCRCSGITASHRSISPDVQSVTMLLKYVFLGMNLCILCRGWYHMVPAGCMQFSALKELT